MITREEPHITYGDRSHSNTPPQLDVARPNCERDRDMALAGLPHEFVQDGLHLTNHSVSEMSAQDTCAPRRMSRARAATAKEAVRLDPFKTVEVELPVIGEETVLLDPVEDYAVGEAVADLPHLDHLVGGTHR